MNIHINRISDKVSGAEIYNIYLLEAFVKKPDVKILFSTNNRALHKRIGFLGIQSMLIDPAIYEIATKRQFLHALIMLPQYFKNYYAFFKRIEKYELVMFESMTEKIFLTIPLSVLGYKVIWIEHGPLFSTRRAWIIKVLYKFASKSVKKIVSVSKNTELDLVNNGISKFKVQTIYIGIQSKFKKSLKPQRKLIIPKNHKVVGFVGTVTKPKGIYHFVDFAHYILERNKGFTFIVLGQGDELADMKAYAKRLGVFKSFIFTGFVNVQSYLSKIDILLFPSEHSEGISIALLEAVTSGIPVVASDSGGNKEIIIDGFNGYICQSFDKELYFQSVTKAIRNHKRISINAKKLINDNFNSDKMVREFHQMFTDIINE